MASLIQPLLDPANRRYMETCLVLLYLSSRSLFSSWKQPRRQTNLYFLIDLGSVLLFVFCLQWWRTVNRTAPDPYMDEIFHVPQASRYCEGKFWEWDDKITTPPGLYYLSVLHNRILGYACTTESFRYINCLGIVLVDRLAWLCRESLEGRSQLTTSSLSPLSLYADHSAVNIALFPPLFFFSGLYYTDVLSTAVVLGAYYDHLRRLRHLQTGWIQDLWTLLLGIVALSMRQTNVFWVVVYMGSMEAIHALKSLKPRPAGKPKFSSLVELCGFYLRRYSLGDIHDPPLSLAQPLDCLLGAISIAIAALCNIGLILKLVWPRIAILASFVLFVIWNGGVVLGDKSNHIATLHLAQMLYIWPLFAFFSAPLLLGPVAFAAVRFWQPRQKLAKKSSPETEKGSSTDTRTSEALVHRLFFAIFVLGALLVACGVVKYSTIVHPFTLADNRHYMFYVFRYTILRSIGLRYALIAVYALSAWLVWQRLAGCPADSTLAPKLDDEPWHINTPFPSAALKMAQQDGNKKNKKNPSGDDTGASSLVMTLSHPECTSSRAPATSATLFWFLSTALSLVTAPLVEPRYFILPWIFWRLLVPAWPLATLVSTRSFQESGPVLRLLRKIDPTVGFETLWLLAINVATMYIFVTRPFVWYDPEGVPLDGGRIQRFIW
ncbi:hypothetical protein VTK73DRAFT_2538 [Phialemonium thermophilum]|uniref:Dol-P-Glc:Glc(2)Man(9)GlcNAc(2)-PP-Dol alpha-1,2-glucosyltransferase n=1 Tax=Phialemonium thermophilum TaxID=223376 RepID=A0ABR3X3T2_9PEZI